jgi:hypothetical protein
MAHASISLLVIGPAVIAMSGRDEAILRSGMNRIAASLSLLAITAGPMTPKGSSAARHNENCCKPSEHARGGAATRFDDPDVTQG